MRRTNQTARPDNKKQATAFRKAARELGCEDNQEQFRDASRKIATAALPKKRGKRRTDR